VAKIANGEMKDAGLALMRLPRRYRRRLVVISIVMAVPVAAWGLLYSIGLRGPTLLYDGDGEYFEWYGVGKLPRLTWTTMRQPGAPILDEDVFLWYARQCTCPAEDGTIMVAVGPEGLSVARCVAPRSPYGGYLRTWRFIPHPRLLAFAVVCALSLLFSAVSIASVLRAVRKRMVARQGLCPLCDYDLTGNVTGRCPECGTPVPKAARQDRDSPPRAD
jgi:hypothetical protein